MYAATPPLPSPCSPAPLWCNFSREPAAFGAIYDASLRAFLLCLCFDTHAKRIIIIPANWQHCPSNPIPGHTPPHHTALTHSIPSILADADLIIWRRRRRRRLLSLFRLLSWFRTSSHPLPLPTFMTAYKNKKYIAEVCTTAGYPAISCESPRN